MINDTLRLDGLTFKVSVKYDEYLREPWKEHDGHGIVSDWQRRNDDGRCTKRPGERVLCTDHHLYGRYLTYDFVGSIEKATKEGWGLSEPDLAKLRTRLKREPTKREIIVETVERDFKRLQDWCNSDWYWCYVEVTLLDVNGDETNEYETLGGIESDAGEYIRETAQELAAAISARVGDAVNLEGPRIRE